MERILATFPYELGDLSPSNSGPRTWFDARASQGQPPPPPAALAELAGLAASDRPDGVDAADRIRALFVNGPLSVARHVLATELVTLGRGPGVDIQADGPSPAEANLGDRAAGRQLASWGVWAEIDAVNLPAPVERLADPELAAALAGHAQVSLKRGPVIVREPVMHELMRAARRVASADVGVLLLGETGVGKDVVASLVHELSPRAERPFVGINCASVPEALLESELFGHERGAFTGAVTAKPGLLEAADGGTEILDEVGDLPPPLQAKLLRVIESREVTRVGAVRPRAIDVRFVAATNRNIAAAVTAGQFRQGLLNRLNCVTLSVPPLRERRAEIEPLVRLFLNDARTRFN